MAKSEKRKLKKYTYFTALLAGTVCGAVALAINYLIALEKLNHEYEALFAPISVGILLCIFNFKPLSKLSLVLLPPVFALLGFAPILGVFALSSLGFNANNMSGFLGLIVQTVPFLMVASFLYRWYAGLAGRKSFISYALLSTITVVTGLLLFKDGFSFELVMSGYLGLTAFLLSRIHVGTIIG